MSIDHAGIGVGDEILQGRLRLLQRLFNILLLDLVLGEVDPGGEVGQDVHQAAAHLSYRLGELAAQPLNRQTEAGLRPGLDDIENGLSLSQIYPAVEESPQGELAGISQPGAAAQDQLQNALQGYRASVAVYLNDVFPGICVGRLHIGHQHLIDDLSSIGVGDMAIDKASVLKLPVEQPLDNGQGFLPAQPHDADAALAEGCGYSGYSILIHGYL